MASWIQVKPDSDFPLRNLPYGVFSPKSSGRRIGVAIGDYVLDLKVLAQEGVFSSLGFDTKALEVPVLNTFAGLGKAAHLAVRTRLQDLLDEKTKDGKALRDNAALREKALHSLNDVTMHLPMDIGDYTDFFVGLPHAQNVSIQDRIGRKEHQTVNTGKLGCEHSCKRGTDRDTRP